MLDTVVIRTVKRHGHDERIFVGGLPAPLPNRTVPNGK